MTIILSTSISVFLLSMFFYKSIHRYKYILYAVTLIAALLLREDSNLVTLGYVPFGIFLVVMYTGVLDKGIIRKRLFMVRAELSIIASILLASHALGFLEYFLDEIGLLNGDLSFYMGVVAFIIVVPLFITSFMFIRRQMGYKTWKKLHTFSYLFYFFVGLHLVLIQNNRLWLYVLLFGVYFLLKGSMYLQKKLNKSKKLPA